MTLDPVILRRVRLRGVAGEMDVRIADGRIAEVASTGTITGGRFEELEGRLLLPGLVDHHVHFTLWAKHRARLDVSGQESASDAAQVVARALAEVVVAGQGDEVRPLVGRGFQDALWPDVPTVELLDDVCIRVGQLHRPVVLLSHDLHAVWINSAAAAAYGAPAGLVREGVAFAVQKALERHEATDAARVERVVAQAVEDANARGVTGILDLEMADNPVAWTQRVAAGIRGLRVRAGVYPEHFAEAIARGDRTGRRLAGTGGLVTVGPLKVFADGALNTRTAWCHEPYPGTSESGYAAHARGDLVALLRDAKQAGFEVALHAIGDRAVGEALDAFEESGAAGSIEHAQLVAPDDLLRFASLGIVASVHPEHALDDREVADQLWEGRTGRAFPYASLWRAGAELKLGSDAPVAPLDPWRSLSAAVHRTRDEREPWEPANALTIDQALDASLAFPRIGRGAPADVIAVDLDPWTAERDALRAMPVTLTMTAGRIVHDAR